MKAQLSSRHALIFSLLLAAASFVAAGCKSTPKIDWDSRLGNYTYDQAVEELGPPDKTAMLSDGKMVADWIQRSSGGGLSFGVGTGYAGGNTAVGVGAGTSTASYSDKVLRLTFGPDQKLLAWWKNY